MALTIRYVTSGGTGSWADATNPATPAPWATMLTDAVAGDLCKIFGSFTLGASSTMTNAGTTTSPIILQGCGGTPDSPLAGFLGRTDVNGALITTNMPTIAYDATFKLTVLGFTIVESLNLTGTITGSTFSPGASCIIRGCKIDNASTNAGAFAVAHGGSTSSCSYFDSDLTLSAANAAAVVLTTAANSTRVICCRIKGGIGIALSTATLTAVGNVMYASGGSHINTTSAAGAVVALFNTLVSSGGSGINIVASSTGTHTILGNMITDNAAYGINWNTAAGAGLLAHNRYRDNTSGNINLGTDWTAATDYGAVTTDTGGPETDYVNAGTNDYNLIPASPAKAAGWFSYMDIGALQRQEAGSAAVFNPLAQTIITVL